MGVFVYFIFELGFEGVFIVRRIEKGSIFRSGAEGFCKDNENNICGMKFEFYCFFKVECFLIVILNNEIWVLEEVVVKR